MKRTKQNHSIDLMKAKIKRHNDDKKDVHVRTRAFHHAKATLLEHRHLVLQGKPGDGKTYIALSLISDLMEMYQDMQILKVNNPNEWEELVDMKQPLIVFMDDVLGKYGANESDFGPWEKLSKSISVNFSDSSIFLILCFREQIVLKVKRYVRNEAFSWMFDSNVINISEEAYCLTQWEKKEMVMKYTKSHMKQTDDLTIEDVIKMKNVIGFPQNCYIWSCGQNLALKDVCANNMFLLEEIKQISRKSRQDYLFLVLLMLSGGSLSLDGDMEKLRRKIKEISELCAVIEELNIGKCEEIGHSLCNTFVEYDTETKKFRFHHACIESAVTFCFGNDYPEITFKLCSLDALTNMCCLRNEFNISAAESFINFKKIFDNETNLKIIMERFSKVLESRERELFQCIAEALIWQSTQFSEYFLKTLTSSDDVLNFLSMKDFDEHSLFTYFVYAENTLVVKGIVDKISQFMLRDHDLVSRQILLGTVNVCLADKADMCNYLVEFQNKVDDFVMFSAASTGNVSLMETLLLHGGNLNAAISDKKSKDLSNTIKNCVSYPSCETFHHDINLLHVACSYGKINMVRYLKSLRSELLHKQSNDGFTAAHFVTRSDNVELMKFLLAEKVDIERKTNCGSTVLHIAAANGSVKMVKYLIEILPQMVCQIDSDGWTVLHYSCMGSSMEVSKALLEKGLDIMGKTNAGENVLQISAKYNNQHMVKYLIEMHPKLLNQADNNGNTAIHYVAKGGSVSMMETMIQAGLDINARNNDGSHVLHVASSNDNLPIIKYLIKTVPQLIHQTNKFEATSLHSAGEGGSLQVIDALMQAGLDIKARTNRGSNILHFAAFSGNIAITDYLVKTYPQLQQDLNNHQWTILHYCSQGGSVSVMKLLLQAGLDIKARTDQGHNVLHIAALYKNLAIVNYVIQECPNLVHQKNNQGVTALHGAAQAGDVQVVDTLIKAGSDIRAMNADGTCVFHMAVSNDRLSLVKYLMEKFPELVQISNEKAGYTSLHYACERSGVPMFEALIQAGVDITARTKQGKTILQLAEQYNNLSVVKYLTETYPQLNTVLTSK